METSEEIEKYLKSGKVPLVKKAAKLIGSNGISSLGGALLEELHKILRNQKLWEAQVEIINALGLIDCKSALSVINEIIGKNIEFDMVTYASATAYVRLSRKDIHDAAPVLELLNQKRYATTCGALDALGYDRMMPGKVEISKLIELCKDLRSPNPKGLSDPRYGLAAACAGWDADLKTDFLKNCIQTGDAPVKHVAENSLNNKYVKLR